MLRNDIFNENVSSCYGRRTHKGSRFNLVGNHGVARPVKPLHPANADSIGSRTADIGSHAV